MALNERDVLFRAGGSVGNLKLYNDLRTVYKVNKTTQTASVSSANFKLVTSTMTGALNIAVGSTTTQNNGEVVVAALSGSVGTASASAIVTNDLGVILNAIEIRDATTNDIINDSDGREIFGLLQCDSTASDGDAIGGSGSENVQISFVKYDASDSLVLVSLNGSIDFTVNRLFANRNQKDLQFIGSAPIKESIAQSIDNVRYFVVTTGFIANEVITVSTGAGATAGVTTVSGDTITSLGASGAVFNADKKTRILLNGYEALKGTDVIWDSSTTFHFWRALDVGDSFQIKQLP